MDTFPGRMNERFRRRWVLLLFGVTVAGSSGRAATDFARAVDCYHARRYAEARERFVDLSRDRAADPELDFYLGRLALWFDDEKAAVSHLERAARLAPDDARIQNALGDAYGLAAQNAHMLFKLGWARRCLAAYLLAVKREPKQVAWRWSLLGYYLVAPAVAGGGSTRAHEQAREIAELDPVGGRVAQATLALAERRYAAAFAIFDAVLVDHPDDFMSLYQIGRCAAISGQNLERGTAALRRCLALRPPEGEGMPTLACVQYRLGNLLEKMGDGSAARTAYAAAEQEHPDFRPQKIALKL